MLWGIWQGKGKPPFNSFFDPFTSEMSKLYNEGKCCNVNNVLLVISNFSSVSSTTMFPFQVKYTALIFNSRICIINLAYQLKVNIHFHA